MDEAFNALARRRVMPWVHGLRMMGLGAGRWPLSSADSVNVARNYAGQPSRDNPAQCPEMMARAIDSAQPPLRWVGAARAGDLGGMSPKVTRIRA